MNTAHEASLLPLDNATVNQTYFLDDLIDATTKLEVYKEKIKDASCFIKSGWIARY